MDKINKSIQELWKIVNSPTISRKEEIEVQAEIHILEGIRKEILNKMDQKERDTNIGISQYGSYFT